jgi:drug/metabolite transporter (DMT)-like permease
MRGFSRRVLVCDCGMGSHAYECDSLCIYLRSVAVLYGDVELLVGKDRMTGPKCAGIVLSLAGCVVAISRVTPFNAAIQFGDLFVLLFTVMMSAHTVFTSGMVKRFGVMASNTEPQILSWRFLPWAKTSLSSLESSKNPS